ncbi:MAG TPA: ABC transporter ATP-binding protein [Anaeromyxobacter sp.]|nr:ABC transporter ATP-binding protein [Anaeromyxobacter sp.]HVP62962.1 ABC transporter ATP-binding protein [Myxococcaceae bacterium]
MSQVELRSMWKIYPRGNVVGVKDLSFTIRNEEFLAILGPSGGGKSSTLRMLAGLEEITRGELAFDGTVVNHLGPAERNIALAFESYALYQRLSVYENIAFPLRARGMKQAAVAQKVRWIAELLDLEPLLDKYPGSLAGGQQQRVSLARAFVRQPKLTLLDEPISHMDQRLRAEVRARIRHLHEEMHNTTVYVTHDQAEAVSLCDRMVILHQAQLQQIGTVEEIWHRPANRFVASFVGEPAMNLLPARLRDRTTVVLPEVDHESALSFRGELDPGAHAEVTIGIRPQEIGVLRAAGVANTLPCIVRLLEFQGENTILTVTTDGPAQHTLKVAVAASEANAVGERVFLQVRPESIHLFEGDRPVLRRALAG